MSHRLAILPGPPILMRKPWGRHWTLEGAEAMLEVRSVFVSDCWEQFQMFRIDRETGRLYPHRQLVEGFSFLIAA